jgi:isopentenyldiphosphate isomerase
LSTLEHISVQQNDPGELLEVFSADGLPTGTAKPRAAIHLEGEWHRAFHCWITRRNGREVVLQRRSLAKDTFAGKWDAAAAGHWRFGESAAEAAREISEELGLAVPFEALRYCRRFRAVQDFPNGLKDRELHEVYLLADDRALSEYQPDPAEVMDVGAFSVDGLIALARGEIEAIDALETFRGEPVRLRHSDMVPYSAERLTGMLLS